MMLLVKLSINKQMFIWSHGNLVEKWECVDNQSMCRRVEHKMARWMRINADTMAGEQKGGTGWSDTAATALFTNAPLHHITRHVAMTRCLPWARCTNTVLVSISLELGHCNWLIQWNYLKKNNRRRKMNSTISFYYCHRGVNLHYNEYIFCWLNTTPQHKNMI